MKIANQYLVKYNTHITEISIRPHSITHWQLPKLTLKVNGSEIKIKDVDLIFDKHLSLFNFSADQLLKIALGSIDVTLSPNMLTNEGKTFDSQGPTLALNIAQLPQIDIGYTQLKFKGIPSTNLSIDLAYLRLDKQGQLTSLLNLQGKKIFALNAQLNEKKWTISTSIVFEQLQTLLTQITQQVHDSSALSLLLQAKARLDKLGLKFNGTLNSQADLNLKTAQLYSIHELVDTEVTLTKLSNLTIQPSTLALLPNTSVVFPNAEPQHSPNRLIKFEINGHIADLSLTLLPLSLQLAPNHQQQAALLSFINDEKCNKIINLLHLGNQKNKKESSKLTLVASLNKPLSYSFQSREIKAQHVQLSLENENVTATSSLKELNLKLPVDDSGPTLNSQWSLKAQTKNRLGLEQLFDENLTSPKLTLAKTSLVMHGELKLAQLNNKALSPSHQDLQFNDVQLSLNVDKEIRLISEGFSVEAVSDDKNAAMNMKVASFSLFSHSPLQASYDSGAVSFVLPSLTLALGPISYYHPQPSAKAKEIEFKANNLTFYAIAPSYLTAEVASDNKHDLANMSFQFTGSTFSLVSSGVRFLDKQLSSLIDKQENAQAQLTPPSVSISTQEARFTSLDTFIVNSVHDNTNTDTGKTSGWLTIQLPSFTLEQTDTEFIHISRQEGQTVVENKEAKAQSPTPRNQEVTGLLPQLSMTIFEPTTLELNLKNGISLPRLLSQTSWVNNAKYHIEGLEVTRLYHKNKRLRTEKLLQLYQGTVTQTFNWNTTRLVTHEQWEFDELELNSEHKVTPNLTHKGLTPLSIEGQVNLDTEFSTILAVVEATYPLPTAFYADGHAALNASYKFTQKMVLANKKDDMSTQKVSQFVLDFAPTLSKLSGSINELPFEEATMDANCQLSLHNSRERETLDSKEQSTLSCPDINLSATAFNPGVLIEDFNSHASLSVSLDSEHPIDPAHKEPSANILANLSDLNIQMNAAGKLLGGEFTLPEFSLKLKERSYGYLVLQGLSLAELIAIQPQVGLYADGTFDGVLPVELVDGKVSVSGGRLAARAPGGLITLNGNPAVEQMRSSQPYLNFAFSALEHLEYSQLSSSFDMEPSGDAILNVNVKGRAKGIERPIHLNYSQEENMLQLLKSLQIGDKLQTQIEQSMN
ncbi:YdbH domain-containing protein [Shewanella sp. D64]|nr:MULTISPECIES: YdbH domain-containing protein [unclassified Shewanella]MEC4725799.1 YdbH domain-containing protein [Shewanella sp. D64]MEC4737594.1 YdbH domain-containing protein [Shewanella sp. E94]WBJ93411.1 YdbH domain-containing protein [Shewanella sp. MTB7]